jgi:MFS family permease
MTLTKTGQTRPMPRRDQETDAPATLWAPPLGRVTIATLTTVAITAFDGLSVVAALPAIGRDLGDVGLLPWVVTLFVLVSAIATIVGGPLIDGWGAQRTFRVGVLIFLAASVGCTFAPTMLTLIVARAVQSLGLGLTMATAITTVALVYPERLQGRAFAAQSLVWGVFAFGGPPLIALAVTTVGWRGVFAANLPVGVIAAFMGWNRLPGRLDDAPERVALDWTSVALLSAFSGAALLGVSHIGLRTAPLLVLAGLLAFAYWRYSGTHDDAVLARRHLTSPTLARWNLFAILAFAGGVGSSEFFALYARGAEGRTEGAAALFVLFMSVGWTIGSIIAGRVLDRRHADDVALAGLGVMLLTLVAFGLGLATSQTIWSLAAYQVVLGVGVGAFATAALTAMQTIGTADEAGRINAAHQYLRNFGISLGIAFAGAILLGVVRERTGDVESVRALLEGDEDVAIGSLTADAIRSGYAWAVLGSVVLGTIAAVPLLSLRRRRTEVSVAEPATTR